MKRTINQQNKFNKKRFAAAAVAGLSAAAVLITAVFSRPLEVEAADTLLGIEKLRARYKASGSEFTILEVVPDRAAAEIGFLVDGYEPVLSEWNEEEMAWTSWQNTLCSLPTAARRKEYIEKKKEELRKYYAEQGIKKNFPVEIAEEEYEESSEKADGFQKLVSDGDKSEGWFEKASADSGQDQYQLSFKYRGKYDLDDYPIDPDLLYYTVSSSMKIDSNMTGGIEDDRFVYKKEKDVFVCLGTWAEIREKALSSILSNTVEEDQDKDDSEDSGNGENNGTGESGSADDGNGSDSGDGNGNGTGGGNGSGDGNGSGTGDGNSGDEGDGGGSGDGNGSGTGDGNGSDDGNDSGTDDGNGGDEGDGGGSGDSNGSDEGDGSGSGDGTGSGTGDGNGTNEGNGGSNDSDADVGSGSNSGSGNAGNDIVNTGDSGSDREGNVIVSRNDRLDRRDVESTKIAGAVRTVVFAAADFRQGQWFRLVEDSGPGAGNGVVSGGQQGSDDNTGTGSKPGADSGSAAGGTDSGDAADSDNGTKPGDNSGGDDSSNSGSSGSDHDADSDNDTEPDDNQGSGDDMKPDDQPDSDDGNDSDDKTDGDDDKDSEDSEGDDTESDDSDDQPAADDPVDDEEEENKKDILASEEVSAYYLVAFEKVTDYTQLTERDSIYTVDEMVLSDNGEYIFVEWDGTDESQTRQVYTFPGKEIWCKNAFKSNEWFRKYVINMDKKDYADFKIKVLTYTPQELNQMEQLPNFQFLYLNSGLRATGIWSGGSSGGESGKDQTDGKTNKDKRKPGDGKVDKDAPDEDDETDNRTDDESGKDDETSDNPDNESGKNDGTDGSTDDESGKDEGNGDNPNDESGKNDGTDGSTDDESGKDEGNGDNPDDESSKNDGTDGNPGGESDKDDQTAGNDDSAESGNHKGDNVQSGSGNNTGGTDNNKENGSKENDGAGSSDDHGSVKPVSGVLLQSGWNMLVADAAAGNDSEQNQPVVSTGDSEQNPSAGNASDQAPSTGNVTDDNKNQTPSAGSEADDNKDQTPSAGSEADDNKDQTPSTGSETDDSEGHAPSTDDDAEQEAPSQTEDGTEQSPSDGTGSDNGSGTGGNAGDVSGNDPGDVSGNDVGDKVVKKYSAEDNDLSADLLKFFFDKTIAGAMPCLVDGSILYAKDDAGSIVVNEELENTNIFRLSAMLCQDNLSEWYESHRNQYGKLTTAQLMKGIVEDADKNFVEEQVYCRFGSDSIINDRFYDATIYQDGGEIEPGFQCVLDEIKLDNLYRESDTSGNYKPLSTSISQAKAVRHILNYRDRRKVETKKEVRVLEIQPAMADEPELSLDQIKAWAPGVEKAEITVMTTAEFVGKIEKLNETYDLIYIGTSKDHLNMRYWTDANYFGKPDEKHVAAGTVFNDVDMDGLIYYNIGDLRVVNLPMAGLLTTEYRNGNRGDWTWFYNYVRYGGNDISKEKKDALLSFLDGSYPVIIADDFFEQPVTVYAEKEYKGARVNLTEGAYTRKQLTAMGVKSLDISSVKVKEGYRLTVFDGDEFSGNSEIFTKDVLDFTKQANITGNWDNKTVSLIIEREEDATPDRVIDEDHIDNCTYLYEFVTKAMKDKYLNFYAKGDIADNSELFKFYLNRPKVSLTNTAVNGDVEEGSDIYYINPDINGKYKLQYAFNIKNEGTASYQTKYRCKLYIDVNSDGKFSKQEEVEDITITQGGNLVSAEELYADNGYLLTRDVPTGYKGLLPWRVEITQADNPNIYTSLNGYTKLNGMDREVLKICQINKNGTDVIDLNHEVNTKGTHFNKLVYGGEHDGISYSGIADEFVLDITTIDVATFERNYYANNEYLKDFNMLILGFSDMYGDFSGDAESGPMGAIVDFINSGKSVLLGHDTTSFFNAPGAGQEMKGYPWRDSTTLQGNKADWYYTRNAATLNKYVRPLVGMDRYGILSSEILQRGNVLQQGTGDYDAVVHSGKDVAYKPKSGKKETVPEVHGYTYALISAKDQKVWIDEHTSTKYQYTKWNLMSPSSYDKSPTIVFENKYTNIRYDAAWFWEAADGSDTDPARYGELEKVNNGEVWNVHATQVNKGQITEYPYKLKEDFEVALTHTQYYELDYTADDDGDGQSDLVVWYCLGGRTSPTGHSEWENTIYSQSPNDVRNNYYIYNKGNITYTGMGHARKNWNQEWYTFEEAKLFINTMIASYQAGIKSPQITVLKKGVPEADELKLLYRYYDTGSKSDSGEGFYLSDEAAAEDYEKLYFTVQDINFVKGTRAIATHVYYKADGGGETINVDGKDISVNRLADNMYNAKDDSPVDANNLTSGGVYYIRVPRTLMKQCGEGDGLEFYFEAQSTITTNTTNANVYITDKVYAKLQVLQAYLFNLE